MKIFVFCSVAAASVLFLFSTPQAGIAHRYSEDFTTDRYKNEAGTTAFWNTNAGRLELPPFPTALIGGYETLGYARDLAVAGNHVFMVDGDLGLQIFDISDPTSPQLLTGYGTSGFASDVTVAGNYAYIADGLSGLQIVDVTDPSKPVFAGNYDTDGYSRGVTVEGEYAFVADGEVGGSARLLVIDVSDPAAPGLAGTLALAGSNLPVGSFVDGDHLYFASGPGGLVIIDISDPIQPVLVTTFPTPTYARNVMVAGNRAFLATAQSGLFIIDVTDPAAPALLGKYDTPSYSYGVAVSGNYVYVADDRTGLQMFDATDPASIRLLATVDTPEQSIGTAVAGHHAYVADGASGLQVIRIGEPIAPLERGSHATTDEALAVVVDGHLAYVAHRGGVTVLDMSDPGSPRLTGSYSTPIDGKAHLELSGSYAYVAAGSLLAFDIRDPANPRAASSVLEQGDAHDVVVDGDFAFVANGVLGFAVADISDPEGMTEVDAIDLPGVASGVSVSGDHAYVAANGYGLVVVDISDPNSPVQAGAHFDGLGGNDIMVDGDHAFLATTAGLRVFDIRDPVNPVLAGVFGTVRPGLSIDLAGDVAVLGCGAEPPATGAIYVIDIADPAKATAIGEGASENVVDVSIAGDLVFVADAMSGIRGFEIFNRQFDLGANVGQSRSVHGRRLDNVVRVRLNTMQTDSIDWEVTADGAVVWQDILANGEWTFLDSQGGDVRWRSTHRYAGAGVNPAASKLVMDWLYHFAVIDSIVDASGDGGGWVNLHFTRSAHDFSGGFNVQQYVVYRRKAGVVLPKPDDTPCTASANEWDVVAQLPAATQDSYVIQVPTLVDGPGPPHSVYTVSAETGGRPTVAFCSPPDSGYSVDNTVSITLFNAQYASGSVRLTWTVSTQGVLLGFNVYRSLVDDDFELLNTTLLPPDGDSYADTGFERGTTYWYRLGVVRSDGQEFLSTIQTVDIPVAVLGLFQNHPNPFNPITRIVYEIPAAGPVSLVVFDVDGALVRTLVRKSQPAGRWEVSWDGRDDQNQRVASGIYFYRLTAAGSERTRKMALIQ